MQKIAEVIEASTTEFVAECYELYGLPQLGAVVKTVDGTTEVYGLVYHATTAGIESGRRPVARGKNESSEEAVYRSNPQLAKLLRSEFSAIVVGHRQGTVLHHHLAPVPARIHGFVYLCPAEEVRAFSRSFDFLNVVLNTRQPVPVEEVIGAALRQMSIAHDDPRSFLVSAGKALAITLGSDYGRLRTILGSINDASFSG
jgi:hypothetical protein